MANEDLFEFSAKMDIEVEKSSLDKAKGVLDAFYSKYGDRKMKVDTSDMEKTFRNGITTIRKLYDQGIGQMEKDGFAWWDTEDDIEDYFKNIVNNMHDSFKDVKVAFSDGSLFSVLDDAFEDTFNEKIAHGITVAAVDLGDRLQYLRNHIFDTVDALKQMGAVRSTWRGLSFDNDDMDEDALRNRIALLSEMVEHQKELELFSNTKFNVNGAPLGATTSRAENDIKNLQAMLSAMEEYNSKVDEQYKITTSQWARRQRLIESAYESSEWDADRQSRAKNNIDDDEFYDDAIESLQQFIDNRRSLIQRLKDEEDILFRDSGIAEYVSLSERYISEYESYLKELVALKNGEPIGIDHSNLSEVVQVLQSIESAIKDVVTAFRPLTDALNNEDSAISAMVKANISDLDALQSKLQETFQNIETLSSKQFNITNVISNNSADNDVEQYRALRKEASSIFKQVEELYAESITTAQKIKSKPGGLSAFLDFSNNMSSFDMSDLAKRIKSRSAKSLGVVIDELNEWKKILLQFNTLRNDVEEGSFNVSRYNDTSSKVSIGTKTNDKDEDIVDKDTNVNNNDILTHVKTLGASIEEELSTIRSKIEETFNLSTLDPSLYNIQTISDSIYHQFVELQTRVAALQFTVEATPIVKNLTNDDIEADATADAIDNEVDSVNKAEEAFTNAANAKNKFADANKIAAETAEQTSDSADDESEAIEGVSKAAARANAQIEKAYADINENLNNKPITVNGTSYEDFQNFALTLASGNNMVIDDVSVVSDSNDSAKLAIIKMVNEELAQSVVYTYKLKDAEEGSAVAYLEKYKASSNVNKALKRQLAEEKKAAAETQRINKEKAQNNEWLIRQQSKLDTQERRYKYSKKSVDGSTELTSVDTSLADDADRTIDGLAKHIRDKINDAMSNALTEETKQEILNDIRILQNEIAVAQNNKYAATNMKASSVKTNKRVYEQYLNALEANAKKYGVADKMVDVVDGEDVDIIARLRSELQAIGDEDSKAMDAFVDNVKVASKRLQAEKAKSAQEAHAVDTNDKIYNSAIKAQEKLYNLKKQIVGLDPESSKGQETMRKLIEAQNEYNESLSHTNRQLLTIGQLQKIEDLEAVQKAELRTRQQEYRSGISVEQEENDLKYILSLHEKYANATKNLTKLQNDPSGASHDKQIAEYTEDAKNAREELLSIGIDLNNIGESELLTEKQKAALLEEQVKLTKQLQNIENAYGDKLKTKEDKVNQKYGKTITDRENRYAETIDAKYSKLESSTKLDPNFIAQVERYKIALQELNDARDLFAKNPDMFNDAEQKRKFQSTAIEVEELRKSLLSTLNASKKFENLSTVGAIFATETIDPDKFADAKTAMIEFAESAMDGKFQLEGFNAAGTEMYGVLNKGDGVIENVTVALRAGTTQLYAYSSGTKQVASAWKQITGDLKSGISRLAKQYVGISEAWQAIKKGFTYVKEIDSALTELKKVTDETSESYDRFLQTMSKSASKIGSTVKDLTTSAADWARLKLRSPIW